MSQIGAAAIGAGASLLGGAMARKGGGAAVYQANKQRWEATRQFNESMKWAEDFAKMGVRWRVDDAKAAGLHPLYALSGNLSPGSPVSVGTGGGFSEGGDPMGEALSRAGQDISRAIGAAQTPEERAAALLNAERMRAATRLDNAQAALMESDLMRRAQNANVSKAIPGLPQQPVVVSAVRGPGKIPSHPLATDAIELTAPPRLSTQKGSPERIAGQHGWLQEYDTGRGFTFLLPYSQEGAGEAWQNLLSPALPFVIGENLAHWYNQYLDSRSSMSRTYRGPTVSGRIGR